MGIIVSNEGEEVREVTSHMEKHVRYSNDTSKGGSSEDAREPQFGNRLNSSNDTVIAVIRDGDSV
ncbi:MAG: hypothetical protein WAV05_12245 [Anaerolineales bacterium]